MLLHGSTAAPEIRGLFGPRGDAAAWLDATARFPNGVPRFDSKQACVDFVTDYLARHGGSNPRHPHLQHIFTTLIGWDQIESLLLPAMEEARKEPSTAAAVPDDYARRVVAVADDPAAAASDGHDPARNSDESDDVNHGTSDSRKNIYEQPEAAPVVRAIADRLNLPIHRCTTPASTFNTLKYLYQHMKFGIFVMIRDNALRIFAPFVNVDYTNTWADHLRIEGDGTLDTYYSHKAGLYREEQIEPDRARWWANGNIICNERSSTGAVAGADPLADSQHWGDHFLAPLRDMLGEACRARHLPDCEFFLNKRDYPMLKVNLPRGGVPVEPYGFIYDRDDRDPDQDVDLPEAHRFATYAPIVSFYAAAPDRFADLPWPSSEDWEAACGLVFPHTFMHTRRDDIPGAGATGPAIELNGSPRDLFTEANFVKFRRGWDDGRVRTAFFRGTATGGGTTVDNNQRLRVAQLSHLWKDDEVKGGPEPYLDAAIVGWNLRDKKVADGPMTFLRPDQFDFSAGRHHFTPIYEQSRYKYLVYIDGHCAACRYGFMMRLGAVILKVESRQVADRMWYFPLLKPYHDHVPVKADLSDLEEKIKWCRDHDDECREIARNAGIFYEKYVGREALLDYLEMCCKNIAARYVAPPSWWNNIATVDVPPPQLRKPDVPCYEDRRTGQSRLCTRCQEDYDSEQQELERLRSEQEEEKADRGNKKQLLRERMRKKAKVQQQSEQK